MQKFKRRVVMGDTTDILGAGFFTELKPAFPYYYTNEP